MGTRGTCSTSSSLASSLVSSSTPPYVLATGSGYGKLLALITRGVIFNIVTRDVHYYTHAAGPKAPMTIRKNPCSHHEGGNHTSTASSPVGYHGDYAYTHQQSPVQWVTTGIMLIHISRVSISWRTLYGTNT